MKRTSLWQRITALLLAVLLVAGYVPVQQVNAAETPMATVDALSSNLNVASNGTAGISITATEGFTLQWVAADSDIGRTQDGWWAGFKVIAPEGINLTDAVYYWNYADGTSSARNFWNVKDSSDDAETHWVEIWKLITPEALNKALQDGKKFTQLWSFDWDGDKTCEQTVSLTLDPTKVTLKTGDVQNYPNYGTVSAITSGVSLNTTNPAKAELSLAETITLDYDEANTDINRTRSGWWIGVKVVAPQLDVEVLRTATYTRKETNEPDKAREFWKNKDSKDDDQTHWIGLWAYVTPEKLTALKAGEMLTHSWEFNWDNNAGIDQVVTIELDPAKLILNKDGVQQYPCYGNVSVITGAEVITLTGSGTASALAEVQAPLKTLVWAPADTSIGRYADGWWIGLKVEAPAGFTEAQADQAKYIRGSGENWESWDNARPFSEYKDGPTHITIWAPITEKILADAINAGVEVLSWSWKFDWLNSSDKAQVVTIQVDPTLVELTNKNGDTGFQFPADPLYGSVSWLTDGITVTENASANVSASNEGKTDVVLQWADTSEGRPTEGWWAGIRIDLPEALKGESFDPAGITLQTMGTAGTWSKATEFKDAYEYDGTSQYLTLWGLINEDRWDTGSDLVYKMRIDWNKDGIYEQLVTLTVDPQNYILKKGDDQVRPHSIGFSVTNGKVNVYGEEYPATITVDYQGGELTYTITPNENYHIQSIQHGDTVLDAFNEADHGKSFTYAFTPDGDVEVTATIVPDQRSFTVVETGKGEVDGNEATTEFSSVDYDTSATYTISTAKGYMAYVNGKPVEDGTYTVKNITEDTVVTVEFCLVEYTITYHSPLGVVPAKETYTIETEDQALAQITGVTGAKFLGWTVGAATQNLGETVISAISGSDFDEIADIELYAVFNVSASFTAQRDGMTILPDTWYDGNRATLEIYTEVKGEGIEYAYSCGEEKGKTLDKVDVSVSGAAEKTYVIDSVTVKDNETSYVYAVATNGFTLKLDDSKPTIAIREGEKTVWETWVDMVIDQVEANSAEKEFTVETTDSGSDAVKVSYVFVPFEKAIAKGIHPSNIDEVLAALGCSWSDYTDKISTSEIENGEYSAYALIVRATDAVGNTSYVDSKGLLFDTIAPEITVSYDSNVTQLGENNQFYSKNDVTVTIHIKDAHLRLPDDVAKAEDYKSYTINFNDQNVEPFESNKTEDGWELKATLTVSENNELKANLIVNATDATGNSAKKYTAELLLDKKAPEINVSYDPPAPEGGNIYTPNSITVTVTVTDPYLDYADNGFVPTIMLNDQPVTVAEADIKWSEEHSVWTGSFVIAAESYYGPNTVTVEATDECGNSAEKYTSPILLIDNTPPVINVGYTYTNGNHLDAEGNLEELTASDKDNFYANGNIVATVTVTDKYLDYVAGDEENELIFSAKIEAGDLTPDKVEWTREENGTVKWVATYTIKTEAVNQLNFTVKDEAGNETKYDSGNLVLDKTGPEITAIQIGKTENGEWEDILNFLTFGFFFNEELQVKVTVKDALSLGIEDNFPNDQTPYATMYMTVGEGETAAVKSQKQTSFAQDKEEDVDVIIYTFTVPKDVLEADIAANATFTATDAAGNTSKVYKPENFNNHKSNTFLFETKVANVEFTDPAGYEVGEEFWLNDGSNVNLTVTDTTETENGSISGIQSVEIKVNGKEIPVIHKDVTDDDGIFDFTAEKTGKESFTIPYASLLDGKNEISVAVVDNAGNKTEPVPIYTVYVDRTKPEIAVSYEYTNADVSATAGADDPVYSNGDIIATITITDAEEHLDAEKLDIELKLNGGAKQIDWTTKSAKEWIGTYTIPKEKDVETVNLLEVVVRDMSLNEKTYTSNDLLVDGKDPEITVDYTYTNGNQEGDQTAQDISGSEAMKNFYANGNIVATVTVTDKYLDYVAGDEENELIFSAKIEAGDLTPDKVKWTREENGTVTWVATYTIENEAVNQLNFTVKDEAGNETKYDSGNLVLDKTGPEITAIQIGKTENGEWKDILNFLTFGFFFNEELQVKVTVKDTLSLGIEDNFPTDQTPYATMYMTVGEGETAAVKSQKQTSFVQDQEEDVDVIIYTFTVPQNVLEADIAANATFTATDAAGNTSKDYYPTDFDNHKSNTFLFETRVADVEFTVPAGYEVGEGEAKEFWLTNELTELEFKVSDKTDTTNGSVSGIRSVKITLNGQPVTVVNGDTTSELGEFTYNDFTTEQEYTIKYEGLYDSLKEGQNDLQVIVEDNAGNTHTTENAPTFTFYKDITRPEIDVDYTYQNAGTQKEETENQDAPIYSNGDIIATITITDAEEHLDAEKLDIELKLNGGAKQIDWTTKSAEKWIGTYTIPKEKDVETVNLLEVAVRDMSLNEKTYKSNDLLVDGKDPVITVDYAYTNGNLEGNQTAQDITGDELENNNFYANGDIQVEVTIKDDYLDFAGDNENEFFPEIRLNGTPAEYQPDWTKGANEWTATYTITPEQVNELTVSVSDEAGNKTNYTSGKLVLDRTAPVIASMNIEKVQSDAEAILNFLTFGIFFNGEIEVTITVKDNCPLNGNETTYPKSQITSALMYIEGVDGATKPSVSDAAAGVFTFKLPDGVLEKDVEKVITFTATDAAGNTSEPVEASDAPYNHSSNTFLYETTEAVVDFSANESDSVTFKNGSQLWMLKDQAFTFVVTDLMEGKNTSGIRSVIVTNNDGKVLVSNTGRADSTTGKFYYTGENVEEVETYQESYSIAYDTLAEGVNEISVKVTDNAGNEVTETYTVYVDKTIPEIIEIAFAPTSKYEEGDHEAFDPVETEYGFYFGQDTVVTITANDPTGNGKKDDISGVAAIHYILDDIDNENDQNMVVTSAELQDNAISFTIPANFKGQIYALALDNVNNFRQNQDGESEFVAPDGTIIANQARHDDAASVTIERAETDWKDHAGHDLYSGDVLLTMNAADTYAGLRTVEWYVELDGRKLADGKVEIDNSANMTGDTWTLVEQVSNLITKLSRTHNVTQEGTGFKAYLKLTDRIGYTSEVENVFSIDRTAPTCEVNYNTPAQTVGNTSYYNQPLVATITITELNFNGNDFVVTVNGTSTNVTWNSEGDKNVATLTLNADNTYVIGVTGQDMAENVMEKYVSENHVVDQTAPVCNVTFSEEANPVGDISYHDEPLVATITIDELNFNENDFVVTVNGEATAVDWIPVDGDTHTVTLTFTEDGEYIIGVTGQDMARNAMEEYTSNTRIVDQNAPAVVTDLQHESANNEENIGFTITIADQNLPVENIKAKLTMVIHTGDGFTDADFKTETYTLEAPVEIEWDEGRPIAYTITVPNLDTDGYYTLTMTVTDLAGNVTTLINAANTPEGQDGFEAVNFTVNREGSVFMIETEHTDKYAEGAPLKNQLFGAYANDNVKVIIHEINVDQVDIGENQTSLNINDGSSTTDVTLVEGTNYVKNKVSKYGGWFENIYTLDNSNFEKDGMYSLSLLTYDKAENSNINTKQTEEGAEPTGTIRFTVDRTNPVISTNVYQDQRINEPQYVVEFQIADANLDESSLVVLVNGEIVSGSALTSLGGNIYQFTITDGLNQTIEITAKDKAKNPSEPCLIENVTVSTNILVLWYANTPLFWGTVGGFVALAALIAWLLIAKKRKEEKAEAK